MRVVIVLMMFAAIARAGVVQAPEGGKPVPVIAKGVVCGPLAGGWAIDATDRRLVTPPAANAPNVARTLEVKTADTQAGCATTKQMVTLIALGAWPDLDSGGITFFPDDGRIELRGQRLKGVQVMWSAPGDDKVPARHGSDACLDAAPAKVQTCAIPLPPGLAADADLAWLPAFGRAGADVVTFDGFANRVEHDALRLRPSKIVLSKPLVQTTGVDVTNGPARVALAHPEAVSSVDCGLATCELADRAVVVRSVPDPMTAVTLRLHLVPRVFAARGDAFDSVVTTAVPLLSCPMSVIAGTVVRDVDDASAVVKLEPGCSRDPNNLRWTAGGEPAEVRKVVKTADGIYVLLHVSRVTAEHVVVTAVRPELDNTIVASATAKSVPLPQPRVSLELKGYGKIDFVPTNRPAAITVSGAGELGKMVPLPTEGAYGVFTEDGVQVIRAAESAEGFVALRLAYRVPSLPAELAIADLAITTERVQRAVREAAVPAAIGASAYGDKDPLVELVCGGSDATSHRVTPGKLYRIPWLAHDSCRVILHRERLSVADGSQEIQLDIDVTKVDNTPRPELKTSEHMVLRPGTTTPRVVPVKSGLNEFDRVEVHVSHVVDESRYVVSTAAPKPGVLAAQWSAIVDGGRFRLYATATIPAGLYRVNNPSGQLTLNFGVLSRLTTLNPQGKEGLFGLEFGVMGLGLIPQQSNVEFPPTLAIVAGLGFRVPLGQGAAIGIQGWVAYEFRDGPIKILNSDMTTTNENAGRWSFIFGPSISFGNVGLNL